MAALTFFLSACDQSGELLNAGARPTCDSERTVEGWTITASLERIPSSDMIASKWEVRRIYSTQFGLRVVYDTSEGAAPSLQIWHDYKSGEFVMRLEGDAHFRMRLNAQYAVSSAPLPSTVFEQISREPVRIEHTSSTNKWRVYETTGLPEAIAAAEADLEAAKSWLANGECRA